MDTGGTEPQTTNPFLMGGFEVTRTEPIFNPFAVPEIRENTTNSNPFLSSENVSSEAFSQSCAYTNPFAQFLMGNAPTPNFFPESAFKEESVISHPVQNESSIPDLLLLDQKESSHVRKSSVSGESDTEKRSPPRRPPPPRPGPPKETKDLILSVTDALEATSSDLLDRLQATRTPSPTPLRELSSPSPTAMIEVNDLLGDDDIELPKVSHGIRQTDIQQEAYNIFDAIANLSRDEEIGTESPTPPRLPAPPSRPPPPQLPVYCENNLSAVFESRKTENQSFPTEKKDSPYTSRKSSLISDTSRKSSADYNANKEGPPLPPPPPPSQSSVAPAMTVELHDVAMTSNSQFRNSFDEAHQLFTPTFVGDTREPPSNYVATRKASHDVTSNRIQVIPTRKKYSLDYSGSMSGATVIKEQLEHQSDIFPSVENVGSSKNIPSENVHIIETSKFPTVISTTPIMSYENITNENLYNSQVNVKEQTLVFDEATEKLPVFTKDIPKTQITFPASTPDPFASVVTNSAPSDFFVTNMNISGEDKDEFDAFEAKFDSISEAKQDTSTDPFDPFGDSAGQITAQHEGN